MVGEANPFRATRCQRGEKEASFKPVVSPGRLATCHQLLSAMNIPGPEKREHAEKVPQNIQDGFLNAARKERLQVTIYLVSGVKLTGRVRSFDKFSLVLEGNNQEQLVFKHAISTIALPRAGASTLPPAPASTPEGEEHSKR